MNISFLTPPAVLILADGGLITALALHDVSPSFVLVPSFLCVSACVCLWVRLGSLGCLAYIRFVFFLLTFLGVRWKWNRPLVSHPLVRDTYIFVQDYVL